MQAYIEPILSAAKFFPVIAFVISIPFFLAQYHRFGSVSLGKAAVVYSFAFYLVCAFALVILPLPDSETFVGIAGTKYQLLPFCFVADFIKEIPQCSGGAALFLNGSFFVPFFNILMLLPFGLYLRGYFEFSLVKTTIFSFLLSLFFELTQLTGLWFAYPSPYRLFDVDDLLLNTLGGLAGAALAPLVMKLLPSREALDERSAEKGKTVSGLRRFTALWLDMLICAALSILFLFVIKTQLGVISVTVLWFGIYYVLIPTLLGGSTLGERFLNLTAVDTLGNSCGIVRRALRALVFAVYYIILPALLITGSVAIYEIEMNDLLKTVVLCIYCGGVALYYLCSLAKCLFTRRPMLYEILSGTRLESTIGKPEKTTASTACRASGTNSGRLQFTDHKN